MSEEQRPIRLAVLGGESTGKTSFISRLTLNIVHESHYPTRDQTNWLFDYIPHSKLAKAILDGQAHERLLRRTPNSQLLEPIFKSPLVSPNVLLSPLVFQAFIDNYTSMKTQSKNKTNSSNFFMKNLDLKKTNSNNDNGNEKNLQVRYLSSPNASQTSLPLQAQPPLSHSEDEESSVPSNYVPPSYSPIPIDIIDTPGFNPQMVVPFLEVSLFRNLDKSILKGLANEPRQPVSTRTLLVASGASELNGKIDGYILVYSAIPEVSHHSLSLPPEYVSEKEIKEDTKLKNEDPDNDDSTKCNAGGFPILLNIRSCILDAWAEYVNYKEAWEKGKEDDIYSLLHNFKNIWKSQESESTKNSKIKDLRTFKTTLPEIDLNPASPTSPPPCIIVCTHVNEPLASPVLIKKGRDLATQWNCGFVGINNIDDFNVDVALSLIIKEIVEKEKLLSQRRKSTTESNNEYVNDNMFTNLIKN
ncbi:similar to Saccharomyces cerevisiae YPR084W Putative protein of unknown function [Maudiozyma saulgeensis]|uniref:Uncharacterized protein n=1 Tax=Maudiozyma saulgeensis TaxID=1789683 RepID=A0A1X7QXI2_9SACH|nr:similar to Saccharomyces cerevisiae YPR084W Putative protein of unknown function [Kazachstania saulgeensis]